jgi:hypothetical protein
MDFSGMINTRGQYFQNSSGLSNDAENYALYDMEFDGSLNIKAADKSGVFLNFEIHDETWLESPGGSDDKTGDDNIAFKRAYGYHTFSTNTKVEFGILTGGAFGTSFADNGDGAYRVKFTQPTSAGVIVALVEKMKENGPKATGDYDAEKDDGDQYALAYVLPMGDLRFEGLGVYAQIDTGFPDPGGKLDANGDPAGNEESDIDLMLLSLNLFGNMGPIGFETEFMYKNYTYSSDIDAEDYAIYGFYANGWMTMDALKVGGIFAYGSWDNDSGKGFGMGDDFEPLEFAANATGFGASAGNDFEFNAVTLLILYADYALSDTQTLNGAIGYYMSNSDENANGSDNFYKDADGYELNAGWTIKFSDATKYTIQGAYAQYNLDKDAAGYDDADAAVRVEHKITVSF